MKRRRLSAHTPKHSTSRSVHISEYIAILREHKWVALAPFLLLLGGSITLTLLATPVYQTEALVSIQSKSGGASLMEELQLSDTSAKVEAEMEIMQSRRVAAGAVRLLTEPEDFAELTPEEQRGFRRMSDFLIEVNRYRPLEVMLRAFGHTRPRCSVELVCSPLPARHPPEQFHFHFAGEGGDGSYTLEVLKVRERRFGSERETEPVEMVSGEPFTAFGRTFTLTVEGRPDGRVYRVTLRNRADLASWLRAQTIVSQLGRNTGIVALGCKAEIPRLAQAAASALAGSFEQTKKTQKRDDANRAVTFLKDRVASVEGELKRAEQALNDFQGQYGVTLLSEKAKLLIDRISSFEREKVEFQLKLEEQEQLIARLKGAGLEVALFATADDPAAIALVDQLTALQLTRMALKGDVTERHPEVRKLVARIGAARESLRDHLLARAEGAAEVTRKRIARIGQVIATDEAEARQLPDLEREHARIVRETSSLVAIHNFLLEKQHEASIARESVFSNVRIVDDAALPHTRTSPNLVVNLLVGLFLALLAALGTAFFAEYLDRSVKAPEELERALGLPLYAALPAFKSIRSREIRRLKSAMVTIEKPTSVLSEGYRSLRANIRFADFESPVRAFAITSAVLGEGKTTTTLNLAVVLAQAGSQVVVVDADMRRPASHNHLKGKLSPGLSDVLRQQVDWRSVVRGVDGVENLSVIHAGDKPSNPGALFDSERFTGLIDELKREYEYVLFDVPPVLAVSDAASFFRHLDALFLLVQWRRCPVDVILAAKEQAERLGAALRGVIFNGFDARKSARRGYGHYGYYGYYGYYGKYRGYGYGYGYVSDRHGKRKSKSAQSARK
ncbi:MAG: polysaccharide biosynthesis tyrosine autokinase [Planctomycetota bacterium]